MVALATVVFCDGGWLLLLLYCATSKRMLTCTRERWIRFFRIKVLLDIQFYFGDTPPFLSNIWHGF